MQWIFRGWYDIWAEAVWETLGPRKMFLVEVRVGENKHRYRIIRNCLKMINIVTGGGSARGHKREKKDTDEKTHLDKPMSFELVLFKY